MAGAACSFATITPGASPPQATRDDGAEQIAIPVTGSLQNPAWSPDGDRLVFTRFIKGYNAGPADLFIFRFRSGATRSLVSDGNDNVNLPGSAWNHTTNRIAFSSSREPHDEIYVIDAEGPTNAEEQITHRDNQMAYEPTFLQDGQWLVFESHPLNVETHGVITTYKIDGSQPYRALTAPDDDCRQPNWSPPGDHILYQRFANGQWDIWVMAADGTGKRQVTAGAGDKTDASFSPDGQWIAYSSDEGGLTNANLFILPTLGGRPTRLTTFNGYDGAPSWSPDGRWIAFESTSQDPDNSAGATLWRISVPEQFRPANFTSFWPMIKRSAPLPLSSLMHPYGFA